MTFFKWYIPAFSLAALFLATGCSDQKPLYQVVIDDELAAHSISPDPAAQACAECHADIVDKWRHSQHGNANRLLSDELDKNAFDPEVTLNHGSFITSMKRSLKGDYLFTTTFSNQPPETYRAEAVIAITPLLQYLVSFPGGRLQVVDLAYDPRSNDWFNTFGEQNRQPHEWGFWKNRSMTWNVQCAFCHTTHFEKNYDIESDSYSSTWKAMGISCAQCHNVRSMEDEGRVLKTNECPQIAHHAPGFKGGIPENRIMDNCASCHTRREELFGSFKAGDDFYDHYRPVLPDAPDIYYPDGQVLDEDFEYTSFMLSRMGHKGVTCLNCHDPHSGELTASAEDNSICMQCHIPPGLNGATPIPPIGHTFHEPGSMGDRCVECHMSENFYMVRDPRRDHGFTSPDPRLTIEHGIPNACNRCHTDQTPEWADDMVDEWYGPKMDRRARDRARIISRIHEGDRSVGNELLKLAKSEEIAYWRATLNRLLVLWNDREETAVHLRADLEHEHPLVRSSAVNALQNNPDAAELIRQMRDDKEALVRLDATWATLSPQEPLSNRLRELKTYLDNISDQPAGALRQAHYENIKGNLPGAETWAKKALAWDPTAVPHYALGRVQHAMGNMTGAASNLTQAALMETNSAEYSFSLALFCAETGQSDTATQWLEETVHRDPQFGRAWYNLGLAYAGEERLNEAARALVEAATHMPTSPEPPFALATVHARMGNMSAARESAAEALRINPSYGPARQFIRQTK